MSVSNKDFSKKKRKLLGRKLAGAGKMEQWLECQLWKHKDPRSPLLALQKVKVSVYQ